MKRIFVKILFLLNCLPLAVFGQNGTEIYLLEIKKTSGGFELINSQNITNRKGYDNQPFFHPSEPFIYYSSSENGQTDIWAFDYKSKKTLQLTQTDDSEYSPTVTPDKKHLTCIVQRKSNGNQDLVKFELGNTLKSMILLESQKSGKIGYHAWSPKNELVAFVLGEPNMLQVFDLKSQKSTEVAQNIGRSLHYVTAKKAFSFADNDGQGWKIKFYDPKNKRIKVYTDGLVDSENYNAWNKDGVLFASKNDELYFFDEKSNSWKSIKTPSDLPKNKISRIAIKDNHIALVINE